MLQRFGHPLSRLLVRRRQKQNLHTAILQPLPRERLHLQRMAAVVVCKLRMNFIERNSAARRILLVHAPRKHRRLALQPRMMQQQPRQFRAGISRHTHHRSLHRLCHDSSIFLSRASMSCARFTSGQITSTVSSPAIVPTTSFHPVAIQGRSHRLRAAH